MINLNYSSCLVRLHTPEVFRECERIACTCRNTCKQMLKFRLAVTNGKQLSVLSGKCNFDPSLNVHNFAYF